MGILKFDQKKYFKENNLEEMENKNTSESHVILLLVAWLEDITPNKINKQCPLRQMKYEIRQRSNLSLDLISLEMVHRSAYGFHDPDFKPLNKAEGLSIEDMKKNRFHILTHDMFRKNCTQYPLSDEENNSFYYDSYKIGKNLWNSNEYEEECSDEDSDNVNTISHRWK